MSNGDIKNAFLIKEYELCFEQLRFYDNRSSTLLKYLFTLTTSVATAQFAIYKLTKSFDSNYYGCLSFLSLIVFVSSLLLFMAMVQNRLYFVQIARQINSIRGFFTEINPNDGFNNQLYTSTDFDAFKMKSLHTFQIIGAAILCGLYAGSFVLAILKDSALLMSITVWAIITSCFVISICSIGAFLYLFVAGKKGADDAIHNRNTG